MNEIPRQGEMLRIYDRPAGVVGAGMVGAQRGKSRHPQDFYPTPPEATLALLDTPFRAWLRASGNAACEVACGAGHISRVLESAGIHVSSSDLVDRGYGSGGIDFLKLERLDAPAIITNPPFSRAARFIEHAMALDVQVMALLLKATFWHTQNRVKLWDRFRPTIIYPLAWRVDFTGQGDSFMDLSWNIWRAGEREQTTMGRPLPKHPEGDLLKILG